MYKNQQRQNVSSQKESVVSLGDGAGNEDSDDEAVDGDDTGHDDRNNGLHDQFRSHHSHRGDTRARLGSSVRRSKR